MEEPGAGKPHAGICEGGDGRPSPLLDQWSPPASLFDKNALVGLPASGIGRAAKCGKEEIVGLLTALKFFLAEDSDERHQRRLAICQEIVNGLQSIEGATVTLVDRKVGRGPTVEVAVHADVLGFSAHDLVKRLQDGDPSVHANHTRVRDGIVVYGPTCMKHGDAAIVIRRVRAELERSPIRLDHRRRLPQR